MLLGMSSDAREFVNKAGPLLWISSESAGDARFRSIRLAFADGVLAVTCNDDTDEIVVAVLDPEASTAHGGGEALSASLAGLEGRVVESAWWMTNERGYTDAFQLRFLDVLTREETTRQFEVAASAITVSQVN
jgi:hypothetical protein